MPYCLSTHLQGSQTAPFGCKSGLRVLHLLVLCQFLTQILGYNSSCLLALLNCNTLFLVHISLTDAIIPIEDRIKTQVPLFLYSLVYNSIDCSTCSILINISSDSIVSVTKFIALLSERIIIIIPQKKKTKCKIINTKPNIFLLSFYSSLFFLVQV